MLGPVDIVIPYSSVYTDRNLLDRALETVANQTVKTNPIVVSEDDQSGVAWARNEGIRRSENRYVALLDADDYWEPAKLERQLARMRASGADLCLCRRRWVEWDDSNILPEESVEAFVHDVLFTELQGFTSSVVFDSEQVDARFDTDLYRREEDLFVIEAAAQAGVCFVRETLSHLDKQDSGLSNIEDLNKKTVAHEQVFEKAAARCPFIEEYRDEYFSKMYRRTGMNYYKRGEYTAAFPYFVDALRADPDAKNLGGIALVSLRYLEQQLASRLDGR